VVLTNQRVYIVDNKLAVMSMVKTAEQLSGVGWLGD